MNVVMLSPGFPDDMPHFTRALAAIGARVFGVGDQPKAALPPDVREALTDYRQVRSLWDEEDMVAEMRDWLRGKQIDRIECLWEPGMTVVARLREEFGIPGLNIEQTTPFRDKVTMKDLLDQAGIRTPHHYRAHSVQDVREAAERIGYPIIVKPVDGAGSADTYRIDDDDDLEMACKAIRHVPEVNVEEFVVGEEFTYDTITVKGQVAFENVAWYRPKPLIARQTPWVSPQAIALKDLTVPQIKVGCELGRKVIEVLGFESGITHMEWFLTESGEAVFGEIGGRAPGGRLSHIMNYACDIDIFRGWAEAVCKQSFSQHIDRRYNAAAIFKRAEGDGHITHMEGMQGLLARYGESVAHIDLVPIGSPRRDYRKVVTGDGWLVVRHPDLEQCVQMADDFSTQLRIFAS